MPKGRFTILQLDPVGEPIDPIDVAGPYKTTIGVIVRDYILIRYHCWKSKKDAQWEVPQQLKDYCWEKLKETFNFPQGSEELAKSRALYTMGSIFKNLRYRLNKLRKDGIEPDWTVYQKQRDYWPEFVAYKSSEDAVANSIRNSDIAKRNVNPHSCGSRGYLRKNPYWEREAELLVQSGVTLQTDGWEP
jgi:hypothetical protein